MAGSAGASANGAIRFLLDGGGSRRIEPLIGRLALAALFIPAGIGKFANHDAYIDRFERWGFPTPGTVAYLVGVVEIVCGLLLLAGVVPRLAAAVLAGNMVGALATAGRIDGGQDIWLPLAAIAVCAVVVVMGRGRRLPGRGNLGSGR